MSALTRPLPRCAHPGCQVRPRKGDTRGGYCHHHWLDARASDGTASRLELGLRTIVTAGTWAPGTTPTFTSDDTHPHTVTRQYSVLIGDPATTETGAGPHQALVTKPRWSPAPGLPWAASVTVQDHTGQTYPVNLGPHRTLADARARVTAWLETNLVTETQRAELMFTLAEKEQNGRYISQSGDHAAAGRAVRLRLDALDTYGGDLEDLEYQLALLAVAGGARGTYTDTVARAADLADQLDPAAYPLAQTLLDAGWDGTAEDLVEAANAALA